MKEILKHKKVEVQNNRLIKENSEEEAKSIMKNDSKRSPSLNEILFNRSPVALNRYEMSEEKKVKSNIGLCHGSNNEVLSNASSSSIRLNSSLSRRHVQSNANQMNR